MSVMENGWQHFDHAADMGICAAGGSLEEVFVQAALGMTAIVSDAEVAASEAVEIRWQAPDAELLLIDWPNALIFEMATRRLLFGRFEVRITPAEVPSPSTPRPGENLWTSTCTVPRWRSRARPTRCWKFRVRLAAVAGARGSSRPTGVPGRQE